MIEIFASLNGEGYAAGSPAVFVRTMGCNLRCQYGTDMGNPELSGFCDTPESLTPELYKLMYPNKEPDWMTAKEIFDKVEELEKDWKNKSICLTGGEPLLECNKGFMLIELIPMFVNAGYDVGIETNGSIDYTDYISKFGKPIIHNDNHREGVTIIADYKLPTSKMTKRMRQENLSLYRETDLIKMVVSDNKEDWDELEKVINSGTKAAIYISPMFGKIDMGKLWNFAAEHADKNIRFQVQLHKIAFSSDPNKKGV